MQGMFAFDIIDHMGGGPMGLSTPPWLEKAINEGIVARYPFLWWIINLVWAVVFIFIMLRLMRHLADYSTGLAVRRAAACALTCDLFRWGSDLWESLQDS